MCFTQCSLLLRLLYIAELARIYIWHLLCCRLLKDDTFADAGYILEMMTQARSYLHCLLSRTATLVTCFYHSAEMITMSIR